MNVKRWLPKQAIPFRALCCALCLLIVGNLISLVHADHPSYPITVNLGPGNADFEKKLKDYQGFSHASKAFERVRGYDCSERDLRRAELHLEELELWDINFSGADLSGAAIEETNFHNCSFRNARLRGVCCVGEIHDTCDLTNADISGSYIGLTQEQLRSTKNYREKNLSDTVLQGDFKRVSFAGFNLRGTVFYFCDLVGCDFTGADIGRATFICRRKPVEGIRGEWYPFTKEQLYSTKSYKEKNLDQVIVEGCDFHDADFSRQSLGHFVWCDLTDADLRNADFSQSLAESYSLPFTRKTTGVFFCAISSAYGLTECSLTAAQFYSTRTYKSAKLPFNFALERMNLDGWDFTGMDLTCGSFRDSSLKGANLTDARNGDFKFAKNLTLEQIKSTWNYKNDEMKESAGDRPAFRLPEKLADALQKEMASERKGAKQ